MKTIKQISYIILVLASGMLPITGCQKNGDLIQAAVVTKGSVQLRGTGDDRYIVTIDGKRIGDTLTNGNAIVDVVLEKKEEAQRVVITNVTDHSVLLDSMIVLPSPSFFYLLLQLEAGGEPVLFSNTDNEPAPIAADHVKFRFIYSTSGLPDSLKMRYYYIDGNTIEYEVFDSVMLHRKVMGAYVDAFMNRYPDATVLGFDLLDAKTGAIVQPLDLDPSSPRFGEGILSATPSPGAPKKQTTLLEFGYNSFVSDTYNDRYLFGSN